MINFPLNIAPGAVAPVAAFGSFVYYESGSAGTADSSIKVTIQGGDGGEYILKVGQGFFVKSSYRQLIVSNNLGAGTIVGNLVLTDERFIDQRVVGTVNISGVVTVTGNVSTIDAGYGRTKNNNSFLGGILYPVPSNYGFAQLWNPPASGKTLVMSSVVYETADAARVYMHKNSAALGSLATTQPISKRFDSAAASVAQMRTVNSGTNPPTGSTQFNDCTTLSNTQQTVKFTDPIVLPQGTGFCIGLVSQSASSFICALFDYYEE